jgi:rod shape-determining protein MreB
VDFAVFFGEEKTLIYKKGQGVVLNEPTVTAHMDDRIVAVGKESLEYMDREGVTFLSPVRNSLIRNVDHAGIFLGQMLKKVGRMCSCLVCVPSSLDAAALNDYKTAFYSAGVADAVFIPQVIASAVALGYDISGCDPVLATVIEGESADLAVILNGEIVAGGTLDDLSKFDTAKKQLLQSRPNVRHLEGNRISVITGAGGLLSREDLVRKIIDLN